jgi:hypothetical protein
MASMSASRGDAAGAGRAAGMRRSAALRSFGPDAIALINDA